MCYSHHFKKIVLSKDHYYIIFYNQIKVSTFKEVIPKYLSILAICHSVIPSTMCQAVFGGQSLLNLYHSPHHCSPFPGCFYFTEEFLQVDYIKLTFFPGKFSFVQVSFLHKDRIYLVPIYSRDLTVL